MPDELVLRGLTKDKALEFSPPDSLDLSKLPRDPPENWLDLLKEKDPLLEGYLDKHIENNSTYTYKDDLIQSLKIIYYRLDKKLDDQLGELSESEKIALLSKLTENINECSAGFHDRVQEIIASFSRPKKFSQLLQLAREDLVQRTAAKLTGGVHTTNTIISLANTSGYGVRYRNRNDEYTGALKSPQINNALKKAFEEEFTLSHLPDLICDQLRTLITHVYEGNKSEKEGYDVGDVTVIAAILDQFLIGDAVANKKETHNKYFFFSSVDFKEENDDVPLTRITDIKWPLVQRKIFEKLFKDGYTDVQNRLGFLCKKDDDFETYYREKELANVTDVTQLFSILYQYFSNGNKITHDYLMLLWDLITQIDPEKSTEINKLGILLLQSLRKDFLNVTPLNRDLITAIVEKCDAASLASGLAEKSTQGEHAGANGWLWLMGALHDAACNNNQTAVSSISGLITAVVKKCDVASLASGLAEKITQGEFENTNGWYCLTNALERVAFNNNQTAVSSISGLITAIVEKCGAASSASGLAEKITQGERVLGGTNGWLWLIGALHDATFNNNQIAVSSISGLITKITEKCDANLLASSLAEKRTQGKSAGTNGWYWLMNSYSNTKNQNEKDLIGNLIFDFLGKLNTNRVLTEFAKQICDQKSTLRKGLVCYIDKNKRQEKFSEKCAPTTMLGALIDTHTSIGLSQGKKTATRKLVDTIQSESQSTSTSSSSPSSEKY